MDLLVIAALASVGWAGPVDLYGFGARSMGRGGGGAALVDSSTGVFLNPSGLSRMIQPDLTVSMHLLRSSFEPLPDVRWDTNRDGWLDEDDAPLAVSTDYGPADGLQISVGRPIGRRLGISIAGFLPVNDLMRIRTFEPALPTYALYENRAHRFELAAGFGWEQLDGLHVGGAVELMSRARYEIAVTLDAPVSGAGEDDAGLGDLVGPLTFDTHRMSLELVPTWVPVVGVTWEVGEALPALSGLVLAGSWRGTTGMPVLVDIDLQANVRVEDVGSLEPVVVPVLAPIQLDFFDHYVPARLLVGAAWSTERWAVYGETYRYRWSALRLSVADLRGARLDTPLLGLAEPELRDGNDYDVVVEDTWCVRMGAEGRVLTVTLPEGWDDLGVDLRAGLSVEPSPLVAQGPESAILDADRRMVSAGLTLSHGEPFDVLGGPLHWDIAAQWHTLARGTLPRSPGAEGPGSPVGASGYNIGGNLWQLGLQLRLGL